MGNALRLVIAQGAALWRRLSPSQRLGFGMGIAVIAIAAAALTGWARRPDMTLLFGGLAPEDASSIVEELTTRKVPYEVGAGGAAIYVPAKVVYELRLSMAGKGLPTSASKGFEIFDQKNLGLTEFTQKVNYQRALEGELGRTILQLEMVDAARVHLVLPERHLFQEDQTSPSASVVVDLRASGELSQRQVQGILHLVAASVEGLSPENITVVDFRGNLLSAGTGSGSALDLTSSQLDQQRAIEDRLRQKAQSLVDQAVGAGNGVVRVTAQLDLDVLSRTEERYDPENTAVRSEQRVESANTAGDTLRGREEGREETVVTNYEINRTLEQYTKPVGEVEKLWVAVLLNNRFVRAEDGTGSFEPRTQQELSKIQDLVSMAVGIDPSRGDVIQVTNVDFDMSASLERDQELAQQRRQALWEELGEKGLIGLLALASLMFVFAQVRRLRSLVPVGVGSLPGFAPGLPARGGGRPGEEPVAPLLAFSREPEAAKQIQMFVERKPEEAAQLVRVWMTDE